MSQLSLKKFYIVAKENSMAGFDFKIVEADPDDKPEASELFIASPVSEPIAKQIKKSLEGLQEYYEN